jgi:hypothetical protein
MRRDPARVAVPVQRREGVLHQLEVRSTHLESKEVRVVRLWR